MLFGDSNVGVILLDSQTTLFPYPFTIQNAMLLLFFIGLGEVFGRWMSTQHEKTYFDKKYLPEEKDIVLQLRDLGSIRRQVSDDFTYDKGVLPALIEMCILQFQSTHSISQVVGVLNSSLDLINQRVDLRYTLLRYITWAIPTFGFIGTVVGIAWTLSQVTQDPDLPLLAGKLAVSFNTTLVALVLSAILMVLLQMTQRQEEEIVNEAGLYTLRNLVNKLYTGHAS